MRVELANLNDCAVPFLSHAAVSLCWYYYTMHLDYTLYSLHKRTSYNMLTMPYAVYGVYAIH